MQKARTNRSLIIIVAVTAAVFVALLNSAIVITNELASHDRVQVERIILQEMTGALTLLLLLPPLLWLMARFPFERGNLVRTIPVHLLAIAAYGGVHTLLMWGSRTVLYNLLGWGPYNYGHIKFRFAMEYGKQFITYCFIYAIARSISLARRARERELRAAQLEKALSEARLSALRMQLNPHFLFNTLNTIASYVYEDAATAERMITRLSDLLRRTLSQSERAEVPLREEMELLDSYISIMKIRFQEKLQISTDGIDPDSTECLVPFLILQPLVENSIRLSTADASRPGEVRITARRRKGDLELIVEDNGPGITKGVKESPGSGIGLSNTKSRLEHLYGDRQSLELLNLPGGGLSITIRIPVRSALPEREIAQCPSGS